MGLLGKSEPKKRGFDEKAAILAFLSPQAGAMYRKRKDERHEQEIEAEQLAEAQLAIENWGKANPNVPREMIEALKLDPKTLAEVVGHNLRVQQYGAAGGSRYDPITGQTTMAPSRHEFQGSVYDVAGGPVGAPATVTPQHEGTQWVTPQPGTTAFGVNSFTGARRMGPPPAAPRIGETPSPPPVVGAGPKPGAVEDGYRFKGGDPADERNWVPVQGGAGPRGPRTFPRFPQ